MCNDAQVVLDPFEAKKAIQNSRFAVGKFELFVHFYLCPPPRQT